MEYCQDISYKTFSTNNGFVGSQAYTYGGDQPHAVTGVTSTSGNIAPSQCQVTYNKFNRPASISEGDYTLSLTCQSSPTLDLAILKKNGTAVCSTLYISRISECEKTAYNTRYIDYIYAGDIPVAIHVKNNFLQTDSIYYVQTDLLGSWERIVDADKQVTLKSDVSSWMNAKDIKNLTNGNIVLSIEQRTWLGVDYLVFKNNGGSNVESEVWISIPVWARYGFGKAQANAIVKLYPKGKVAPGVTILPYPGND